MGFDFNADDIFEMAEQMERNGAKFYRTAAEKVADSSAKEFLLELAGMEDEHEKTFALLRADLSQKEKMATIFDPEGESALYLRALADTEVFFKKEIDVSSMEEILKAAIMAEKDSIVFYLGMMQFVPEELGKDKLGKIIKEEMGHIKILSNELVSLNR
jgi:rubrerythrin